MGLNQLPGTYIRPASVGCAWLTLNLYYTLAARVLGGMEIYYGTCQVGQSGYIRAPAIYCLVNAFTRPPSDVDYSQLYFGLSTHLSHWWVLHKGMVSIPSLHFLQEHLKQLKFALQIFGSNCASNCDIIDAHVCGCT